MKRLLFLLCLLVSGVVGTNAADPPAPAATPSTPPVHSRPTEAVFSDHTGGTGTLPPASIGRQAALQLQQSGWPGPAPARESLAHVDLDRNVRLAVLVRPAWEPDPLGHTRLNVGLVGLRW